MKEGYLKKKKLTDSWELTSPNARLHSNEFTEKADQGSGRRGGKSLELLGGYGCNPKKRNS
jgi:hypothetical protein